MQPPPSRKRHGQNFLIDPNIVRKIITIASLKEDEPVVEIGPGRGVLTRELCAVVDRVTAIEIDSQLVTFLHRSLGDYRNLDLRHGDALEFPYENLSPGTVVVANLPYYISTPLLFRLLEARHCISRMVLMLQTEVARRVVAQPGTKEYSALSVLLQSRTIPTMEFQVSPNCFRPRPKVGSSVVSFHMLPSCRVSVPDEAVFSRTVRAAFAYRRKNVANSLSSAGYESKGVKEVLIKAGIDPSRRAETLTLEEFAALATAMSEIGVRYKE